MKLPCRTAPGSTNVSISARPENMKVCFDFWLRRVINLVSYSVATVNSATEHRAHACDLSPSEVNNPCSTVYRQTNRGRSTHLVPFEFAHDTKKLSFNRKMHPTSQLFSMPPWIFNHLVPSNVKFLDILHCTRIYSINRSDTLIRLEQSEKQKKKNAEIKIKCNKPIEMLWMECDFECDVAIRHMFLLHIL